MLVKVIVLIIFTQIFVSYGLSQWVICYPPIGGETKEIFFSDNNTGYIATLYSTVYKTTNKGETWIRFESINGLTGGSSGVYFINNFTGYTCGYYGKVHMTTNGGYNWISRNTSTNYGLQSIYFLDSLRGFTVGVWGTSFFTTNSGINWNNLELTQQNITLKSIFFPSRDTGYIVGYEGKIFKTTDSGINWNELSYISPLHLTDVYFINNNTGFVVGENTIIKTINGGLNWTYLTIYINYVDFNSIYFPNNNTGYFIGGDGIGTGVIYKTTNSGATWSSQNNPVISSLNSVYFINENTGFISGFHGEILKTTNGGGIIGISQISNEIPLKYYMQQNYPNPFNPVTNIKFDIPNRSNVKISVFDILGKEISILVNEELNPGTFEVNWDASNFPSGVYFYKLLTDGFTNSKKMVLIK